MAKFDQSMSEGSEKPDDIPPGPSRSLNAKRLRQAAENDVQFLANRIAKLKAEELKARREIEKTKSKTKEILGNRKSHDSKVIDKTEIREHVVASKKEERVLVSLSKDKQIEAVYLSRQKLLQQRQQQVNDLKKQKQINECRVYMQREEERGTNIKKREQIKKQQAYAKLKKEEVMKEKEEEVKKIYEEKIAREEAERERQEKLAIQLVAQEAQLIYRLKHLHQDKQKVIRDLASAVDCLKAEEMEATMEGGSGTVLEDS